MKLQYITVMTRDLERSLAFYQALAGLQVARRFNPGGGEIAFLANAEGETMLELVQFEGAEKAEARGLTFSFRAEDLGALRAKALELGWAPSEIVSGGPKPDHFTVRDPDGLLVEFGL